MPNAIRNIATLAGVAALAGGTAFYIATRQNAATLSAPTPTASPAPMPAPMTAPAPAPATPAAPIAPAAPPASEPPLPAAPDAAADPTVWPSGTTPEKFVAFAQPFTLMRDSAAYSSASGDAPQLYPLKAGTALLTTEKSTDGKWVISMTEDGRAAYLLLSDLGPYDPTRHPAPDLPDSVEGPARVIDTATLSVNDQTLNLDGVTGLSGDYAVGLQKLIDRAGSQVSCSRAGESYVCKLPDGQDVARSSLYNGAARASDDASADYRAQESTARQFHRGVWK